MRFESAISCAVAIIFACPVCAQPVGRAGRPNIVFILADDMGWGDLGCYGHKQLRTPNLDRLARGGLRFTQFYSCASVCSPSRAAFLTGQFPARLGIHGHLDTPASNEKRGMPNYLDPHVRTFARVLQSAGYATGHVGKWHLGHSPDSPHVREYGFDYSCAVLANEAEKDLRVPGFWPKSSELFVDKTIEFIEKHREGPFYVQTWLLEPHAPLQPTPEQLDAYKGLTGSAKIYYSVVTNLDRQVGRLMDKLAELHLDGNTIVLFSSDNGPEELILGSAAEPGLGSAGPLRGHKRSLYEGGIRMPLIVRWPGVAPAGRVDSESVICAADFLPTLAAIAGVGELHTSGPLDGESVLPAWRGQGFTRTKPLMWEWRFDIFGHFFNLSPMLAMREGRYKLLMNPDASRVELYDLVADPSELTNLTRCGQNEKTEQMVSSMSERLLAWQKTLPPGPRDANAGKAEYPWPKSLRE